VHRAAILLPAGLTIFGAIILWQSLATMDYFYVARGAPGPGFLPFWLSLGVVALGVVLTFRAVTVPRERAVVEEWPDADGRRKIGVMLAGFVAALLALQPLGFLLTSILFVGLVAYTLGFRPLKILVPVAILTGVFFHVLFTIWLRVGLPQGILSF
jgi:putative tricarboxylic transport membrane protein